MSVVPYEEPSTSVLGRCLSPKELISFNKGILLEVLSASAVATATVTYSGAGDEGQVNEVCTEPCIDLSVQISMLHERAAHQAERGWIRHQEFKAMSIEDALTAFAEHVIWQNHSGYEINDGGHGELVMDCQGGRAWLDHHDCYVETEQTVTEL